MEQDNLTILVYNPIFHLAKYINFTSGIHFVHKSLQTNKFVMPKILSQEIKQNIIGKYNTYNNSTHLMQNVNKIFSNLQDRIFKHGGYFIAWSDDLSKHRHETQIHSPLELLISSELNILNLDVQRETLTPVGAIDFLITGIIKNHATGQEITDGICVEVKKAHHQELIDGLTKQLPAYIDRKGMQYGIYCVLWFGDDSCSIYKEYKNSSLLESALRMYKHKDEFKNTLRDIEIYVLDVSKPEQASTL